MTRLLYMLGRWCARHGWLVIGLWAALLIGTQAADRLLPPPALDPFVLEGTDSASAQKILNSAFPGGASDLQPLVISDRKDLSTGEGADMVDAVRETVAGIAGVNRIITPEDKPELRSEDDQTVMLQLGMAERAVGDKDVGNEIYTKANEVAKKFSPTAQAALGGYLGQQISRTSTKSAEGLGLLMAIGVLWVTLRRGWAVLVPIATAIVAVGTGLAVIHLLGRTVYIPEEAPTLGTMLGLGVGIDYALFLITKHRSLLRRGFAIDDSLGRTAGTAGAGMVFAGCTLVAAVGGLALTGISFLAWLGYSAAIVVVLALAAALTLVPAMLGAMSTKALTRGGAKEYLAGISHNDILDEQLDHGFWARVADAVTTRPWRYALTATAVLLAMAAPMLSMTFSQTDASVLPAETSAHQAGVMIEKAFGPGASGPLTVVAQLYAIAEAPKAKPGAPAPEGDPRRSDPRLTAISAKLATTPGIDSVGEPFVSPDGGAVVWRVQPKTGPADKATENLVAKLRTEVLPSMTQGANMVAYVGGLTASRADLTIRISERLLGFIVGVASLSFVLLMIAYRSLVIPLKAAAMNLISISAAYGVVVMVFEWGWGATLIGLDGPIPIESYVPMMMFAILFGLSMDYEVFLLTSFQEHVERGGGNIVVAVRRALSDTGQVITSAALIMVVVFSSFVLTDNGIVKMFGVGLATAVFVDATIVRCVLVPSLMVLAAKGTWWLPGWLDRAMPKLHVEGDPAALDSIEVRPKFQDDPSRPMTSGLALALGVGAGWVAGNAAGVDGGPYGELTVAVGALAGAAQAWFPRGIPGTPRSAAVRLFSVILGLALSGATFGLLGAISVASSPHPGRQIGLAVLIPAGLILATRLRRVALPALMGVLLAASAIATGSSASPGAGLVTGIVSAVAAFTVAALLSGIGAHDEPKDAHQDAPASEGTLA